MMVMIGFKHTCECNMIQYDSNITSEVRGGNDPIISSTTGEFGGKRAQFHFPAPAMGSDSSSKQDKE